MSGPPAPHDYDAERWLIGALTWRPSNMAGIYETGLEPGHFHSPRFRRLYGELYDHWLAGTDPDPGLAHDPDGNVYLCPQVSRPDLYAARILEMARRRAMLADALGRPRPHHAGWAEWAAAKDARLQ